MKDVWPFPEQQLFICLVGICKVIQNKIVMLHYFSYKAGEKPDLPNRQAFLLYLSALHYVSPQEIHPYS